MTTDENEHNTNSNLRASYLKHRGVVVEWMVDVCEYFNLHPTTSHGAVAYLDRLQPNEKFSRYEWQMVILVDIYVYLRTYIHTYVCIFQVRWFH